MRNNLYLYIGIALYIILCLIHVIRSFVLMAKKNKNISRRNNAVLNKTNEQLLSYMNQSHSSTEYADAFVQLTRQNYVAIHHMSNKGNRYDDELQVIRYRSAMSENAIQNVKHMKGTYI